MRAIVNGKLYDTETANLIASHEHVEVGFLFFIRQQLYITRDGEYFLFGQPGGDSRYRYEEAPRKWVAGWRIDPISYDEAREWLKENLNADYRYERLFGRGDEDFQNTYETDDEPEDYYDPGEDERSYGVGE